MDKILEKWEEILQYVKKEHELSDISFDTWLKPLEVYSLEENLIYILVPNTTLSLFYRKMRRRSAL